MAFQREKRPNASFYYDIKVRGRRYRGTCENCRTQKEADAYENKIRETARKAQEQKSYLAFIENFRDELTGGVKIRLAEAYERYLAKPTRRIPSEDQIQRNRTYWNDFLAFMTARYPNVEFLADVTKSQAEDYITYIRKHGAYHPQITMERNGKKSVYLTKCKALAPRTLNGRHKAIKAVFARLKDDAGVQNNPFDILTLTNHTTSREAFSPDELMRIQEHMTMPYTRPVFVIGLCTGLTLGDICLLKWDEISDCWITNKTRRKTGSRLEIPILPPLKLFLDELRAVQTESPFVCPELAELYQRDPGAVVYRIRQMLKAAGIETTVKTAPNRRAVSVKAAHAMRHTFAAFAGIYNIPQPIVQSVLGHMTLRMTELYQQHATREQKQRFFQQMPNLLGFQTSQAETLPSPVLRDSTEKAREKLSELVHNMTIENVKKLLDYCNVEIIPSNNNSVIEMN